MFNDQRRIPVICRGWAVTFILIMTLFTACEAETKQAQRVESLINEKNAHLQNVYFEVEQYGEKVLTFLTILDERNEAFLNHAKKGKDNVKMYEDQDYVNMGYYIGTTLKQLEKEFLKEVTEPPLPLTKAHRMLKDTVYSYTNVGENYKRVMQLMEQGEIEDAMFFLEVTRDWVKSATDTLDKVKEEMEKVKEQYYP
ncbi:hypothetical protein [Salirhabdus salicampi]|uniref:hypothetical protein n=1 Tax=Salirhabdus salicampi TaxID=476102 RepID=UPI0020C5740B|nr:hypothetical protein [Salirhabdus salicampi]MCP8615973.1 hypothetical protein [Salirhabdus salicampi]